MAKQFPHQVALSDVLPHWIYEKNKQLEILCRLLRKNDKMLRTQIRLGRNYLELLVKMKGDRFYKQINLLTFGDLPEFNFRLNLELPPGLPGGRREFGELDIPI